MPRARNIKPSICRNEDLAELPPLYRLTFIYSWMFADFNGVLEYRPKRLKIDLLPYDDVDIEKAVQSLVEAGFCRAYTVQGKRYIKLLKFEHHQNPHKHERDAGTDLPDIDKADPEEARKTLATKEVAAKAVQSMDKAGPKPEVAGLIPDSLLLIPDSNKKSLKPMSDSKQSDVDVDIVFHFDC